MIIKYHFFDSNIVIAFIFCFDKWYIKTKKIFKLDNIYCSKNVKSEIDNVLDQKIDNTNYFFYLLSNNLLNSQNKIFNNLSQLKSFALNMEGIDNLKLKINIPNILKFSCTNILNLYFPINSYELHNIFKSFGEDFVNILENRREYVYNMICFFENHSKDYYLDIKNIENMFHGKNRGGDLDILYDICQYSELLKNRDDNNFICFLTADNSFYKGVEYLLDMLPIDQVKHLNDFK